MNRVLIGGVAAGVVLFVWGAISHMALPIGEMGIDIIEDEAEFIGAMENSIRNKGLYFFPSRGMHADPSGPEYRAWEQMYREGPRGILVYHPDGAEPMSVRQLVTQLFSNVVCGLIAALVVSFTNGCFRQRLLCVALLGPFVWFAISVPYWNWYGFPGDFSLAALIDLAVGWSLAGLVIARIVSGNDSEVS